MERSSVEAMTQLPAAKPAGHPAQHSHWQEWSAGYRTCPYGESCGAIEEGKPVPPGRPSGRVRHVISQSVTTLTCSCGWSGSHHDFPRHAKGNPLPAPLPAELLDERRPKEVTE